MKVEAVKTEDMKNSGENEATPKKGIQSRRENQLCEQDKGRETG